MGLSCYEHDAEAIRDFLMATNEDYDIKDALIALTSIVAGLQNPPKSESIESPNSSAGKKAKVSLPDGEHNNERGVICPSCGSRNIYSVDGNSDFLQCADCKRAWVDRHTPVS